MTGCHKSHYVGRSSWQPISGLMESMAQTRFPFVELFLGLGFADKEILVPMYRLLVVRRATNDICPSNSENVLFSTGSSRIDQTLHSIIDHCLATPSYRLGSRRRFRLVETIASLTAWGCWVVSSRHTCRVPEPYRPPSVTLPSDVQDYGCPAMRPSSMYSNGQAVRSSLDCSVAPCRHTDRLAGLHVR